MSRVACFVVLMTAVGLGVVACAMQPKVISSNSRTVVVRTPASAMSEGQRLADAECAKEKRTARLHGRMDPYSPDLIFDCVQ